MTVNEMRRKSLPITVLLALATFIAGCTQGSEPRSTSPATTPPVINMADTPIIMTPANNDAELPGSPTSVVPSPVVANTQTAGQAAQEPTAVPLISPTAPPPAPSATAVLYNGPPLSRGDFGVQIHLHREDLSLIMEQLNTLGVGWVKTQVSWKLFEPEPDRYDGFLLGELDGLVEAASANDIRVMLGIAKAPEWSRPTTELDGPPSDSRDFTDFMAFLAGRYKGRVAAYEIWNEANLQREWNGFPLSAADLVDLLRAGAAGVRAADPEAIIIAGAAAPTGINDGITAIDDRLFVRQMVEAGVSSIVDALGAHPYGWANPPGSSAADPDPSVPSHNDHPSFFFSDTLADYRAILEEAGQGDLPLWVTEFGWGSYDGLAVAPPPAVGYMGAVDEQQQATYTVRAYELARDWDWVGPLVLWNLNFAPTFGTDFVESTYSLLRPDGSARPVFQALVAIPKSSP